MERENTLDVLLREGRRKSRFRRIIGIVALVVAVSIGAAVAYVRLKMPSPPASADYVTERITRGDLTSTISATGTVEALNTVEVGAEISGRILSLHADFNDTVTAGQVLAKIDPEQHQAALAQAQAQMLAAQAQVAEAEATLTEVVQEAARSRDLSARGLLSDKELAAAVARSDRASAALKSAQASAALAKATFDAARSRLSRTEILSPIAGTVLSREVEVGQTINAGMQTPVIFIIAEDLRRMRLSSRVDEADIGNVRRDQPASFTVDAYPGKKFSSTVTAVRNVPKTDQNVVSYEVLLSVDNGELLLKPGMTASVEIVTAEFTDVLLVPNKALRFSPPRASLFRGPPGGGVPLLRKAQSAKNSAPDAGDSVKKLGRIDGNEGILWVPSKAPGGPAKPVKVKKTATDGILTAIQSTDLREGDAIIVEQADPGRQLP